LLSIVINLTLDWAWQPLLPIFQAGFNSKALSSILELKYMVDGYGEIIQYTHTIHRKSCVKMTLDRIDQILSLGAVLRDNCKPQGVFLFLERTDNFPVFV
jgi:hypothetical protein